MEEILRGFNVVPVVVIIAFASYALKYLADYLAAKKSTEEDDGYNTVLMILRESVQKASAAAVAAAQQIFVDQAKTVSRDGKLSEEEKTAALDMAVELAKKLLTTEEVEDAKDMFEDLDETIKAHIEEIVYIRKVEREREKLYPYN